MKRKAYNYNYNQQGNKCQFFCHLVARSWSPNNAVAGKIKLYFLYYIYLYLFEILNKPLGIFKYSTIMYIRKSWGKKIDYLDKSLFRNILFLRKHNWHVCNRITLIYIKLWAIKVDKDKYCQWFWDLYKTNSSRKLSSNLQLVGKVFKPDLWTDRVVIVDNNQVMSHTSAEMETGFSENFLCVRIIFVPFVVNSR